MANMAAPPSVELTGTAQTIYTCPSGKVVGCRVVFTNIDGTNAATVTLSWTDSDQAGAEKKLWNTVEVAADDVATTHQIVLEAGDTLKALASLAGDIVATVVVLNIETA